MGREGLQGWMRCVGDETDCTVEAGKGIEESRQLKPWAVGDVGSW